MASDTPLLDTPRNTQAGSPAASTLDGAGAAVKREMHNFLADVECLVAETTTLTGADLKRARDKLGERFTQARASVEEMGTLVSDRTRQTLSQTNRYVHDEPWQAIGVAAVLGVLLGVVIARRA